MHQNVIVGVLLGTFICGSVIVAAILAFLGLMIVSTRWESRWLKMLRELAAQRGWTFQTPSDSRFDCIITGQEDGIPWELTYWRKRTRASTRYTAMDYAAVCKIRAPLADHALLIYPRIAGLPDNLSLDPNGMAGMVLQHMMSQLGVDIMGMTFQHVGATEFESRFMALSRSPETVESVFNNAVEHQLVSWPPVRDRLRLPSIHTDAEGVTVSARRDMSPLEVFGEERMNYERALPERLVRLCIATFTALHDSRA